MAAAAGRDAAPVGAPGADEGTATATAPGDGSDAVSRDR